MKRLSAAVLLLVSAAAAHAQETTAPATPSSTAASNPPIVVEGQEPAKEDKVVCRRERETGSIRSRRVCRSESQIAQEQSHGERTLDTARTQRNSQNMSQNHSGG